MEPSAPKQETSTRPPRRHFFEWVTRGLGAIAGVVLGLPVLGYFLGTPKGQAIEVDLGPLDQFALNDTVLKTFDNPLRQPWDGITSYTGVYVRNVGGPDPANPAFLVFAMNCAHLGCPVSWFPQSGLFMCPCHGGVYYATGEHASGPPPRGLFHCAWRIEKGRLLVQAPHYPTLQNTLREHG
jgi:menaquinol-cytochrome c reductase iron-sulfur subunit